MLTPDSVLIGKSSGLTVPGVPVLGKVISGSDEGVVVLDLLAAQLDSRIMYTGPEHYYWTADGALALSAANEWPLEYRNGYAVGRHEPEPQATNEYYRSAYRSSRLTITDSESVVGLPGLLATETADAGAHYLSQLRQYTAGETLTFSAFAQQTDKSRDYAYVLLAHNLLVPKEVYAGVSFSDASISWSADPAGIPVSTNAEVIQRGILNIWGAIEVQTSSPSIANCAQIGNALTSLTDNPNAYGYEGDPSYSTLYSGIQLESGPLRTSPIVATAKATSRAASSVTIDTSSASSITLFFSNGDQTSYDTPGASFTLPTASLNWSERYITEIKMEA